MAAEAIRTLTGPIKIRQEPIEGRKNRARWIAMFRPDLVRLLRSVAKQKDFPNPIGMSACLLSIVLGVIGSILGCTTLLMNRANDEATGRRIMARIAIILGGFPLGCCCAPLFGGFSLLIWDCSSCGMRSTVCRNDNWE